MPEVRILTEREVMGARHAEKRPGRADDLWVVVAVNGKRKRTKIGPPTARNREKAEETRADWQSALDHELGRQMPVATVRSVAADFIEHGMRSRAPKTVSVRTYQIAALVDYFGDSPLDQVDVGAWWQSFIEGRRDWRTGKFYLNALSLVFKHAQRIGISVQNPVPAARAEILGDISNTKAYRQRNQQNVHPLSVAELRRFLPELAREQPNFVLSVLLMYECGLRFGEMRALTWGDVWLGANPEDTTRRLYVRRSETDGKTGGTKSGQARKVGLSLRLRAFLARWHLQSGRPDPEALVVRALWGRNYRNRLGRVCERAKIPRHTPKDFRDTYASNLITHGIVLKWVSLQLGHTSVATTEKHYAAYMAIEGYENPWRVPLGCLPSDLFAELDQWRGEACQHTANISQHEENPRVLPAP